MIWECVVDKFLLMLFRLWIVDWNLFWSVFKLVWMFLILDIVVLMVFNSVVVFEVVLILLLLILRLVVLNLVIDFRLLVERFIEIVWFVLVFIRNEVEKLLFKMLMLLNWVFVVICEILVCSVDIFFWSVKWLVEELMLFCDWIDSWWICCRFVVILLIVFLVVCVKEIVLFVLCIVWFKFLICDVSLLEIWRFVVLFVVLLILKFEDNFLNDVLRWLFMLKSWCCVLIEDIFVLMNKFIGIFFRDLLINVVWLNFFSLN